MPVDPRVPLNLRVAKGSRDWLDEVADEHRVDRSAVVRAALALAHKNQAELAKTIESRR